MSVLKSVQIRRDMQAVTATSRLWMKPALSLGGEKLAQGRQLQISTWNPLLNIRFITAA
jgi:hypothetical protein